MFDQIEIRGIRDPFADAKANGWDITNASALEADLDLDADVVVVGTGSGGGVTAEILSQAGLKVVLLEEGMLKSSDQFNMVEREGLTGPFALPVEDTSPLVQLDFEWPKP